MRYKQIEDKIIMDAMDSFEIEQILECGQCFRFRKLAPNDYVIVAWGKVLRILQTKDEIIFYPTSPEEFENLWSSYFDLDKDYDIIKQHLAEKDIHLAEAVQFAPGIRILRQEPWECLISFIISQNKQIPHIKQVVENISRMFGRYICNFEGYDYYAFPTVEELSVAKEEDIRACKAGFRAPYIMDACQKIKNKEVELEKLVYLPYEEAKKELLKIKGVGSKIADCVLLFGIGHEEAFPIDVWVKRIMEYFYFDKDTNSNEIQAFAKDYFGNLAGISQQYLFYYARQLRLGK
ncbi:MAG: N-glycosylase [Epulopiscium sp.]|nr:N-glycosylase [Candidatus Epulonipiscium sp.]